MSSGASSSGGGPHDARLQRVAALYKDIMDRVVEGIRPDVRADGLDESVLVELRRRWQAKLDASGVLTAGEASRGLVNTVGAGQSIVAAQYAAPAVPVERSTTAQRARQSEQPTVHAPITGAGVNIAANLSAGVPRGAVHYGTAVHDGAPEVKMEPPEGGPTGFPPAGS